jgi:hypothetical protein
LNHSIDLKKKRVIETISNGVILIEANIHVINYILITWQNKIYNLIWFTTYKKETSKQAIL